MPATLNTPHRTVLWETLNFLQGGNLTVMVSLFSINKSSLLTSFRTWLMEIVVLLRLKLPWQMEYRFEQESSVGTRKLRCFS
jgi:hypothetical protein